MGIAGMSRGEVLAAVGLEAELRGLSDATREAYVRNCGAYLDFFGGDPPPEPPEEGMRAWAAHLRGRGLAPRTSCACLSAVSFMYEAALGATVNRRRVPYPKRRRTLPQVLTRDEARALLRAAASPRDLALLSLGYGCGLRVSEARSVRARDVDSAGGRLLVEGGKGGKDRWTVLPACVCQPRTFIGGNNNFHRRHEDLSPVATPAWAERRGFIGDASIRFVGPSKTTRCP